MQTGKLRTVVQRLHLSRRDTAVTAGILLGVSLLCLALWQMDPQGHYVAELYLLAVFLIGPVVQWVLPQSQKIVERCVRTMPKVS